MFDGLSGKLTGVFDRLHPPRRAERGDVAEAHARGPRRAARGRRRAAGGQGLHRQGARAGAVGQEVIRSVTPGQMVVKIVHDELVAMLGAGEGVGDSISKRRRRSPILMVGLQGSGKTTTTAKLALRLHEPREEEGADGLARRAPPGRAGAARDARRAGRRRAPCRSSPASRRSTIAARAMETGAPRRLRRRHPRHRRPPAHRRGADGRSRARCATPSSRTRRCWSPTR